MSKSIQEHDDAPGMGKGRLGMGIYELALMLLEKRKDKKIVDIYISITLGNGIQETITVDNKEIMETITTPRTKK